MAKKYKIVLSVLFVVLVAVAAVVVSGVLDVNRRAELQPSETQQDDRSADYTDFFSTDTSAALPLLKTTLDGVYYTMSKQGEVTFYEISDGAPAKLGETGSFEVKAECSSQELPAVIHYLERDGHVYGCGLFTNLLYPDVLLYDYGFFEVTDMFEGMSGKRLLMIDVDSSRFYSNDKVFSEVFALDGDNNAKFLLSENQRTVDFSARMKTDYHMFTNGILSQTGSNVLFFSSRYYVEYAESGKLDIFTSGGSGENVDNVRYVVDIASLHFWRTDGGVRYFTKTADGFELRSVKAADADPEVIERFSGDINKDYIVDGPYLFNKTNGQLYNVLTGESASVDYGGFRTGFKADTFAISPNGLYCLVRGANTENVAAVGLVDLKNDRTRIYTDEVFGFLASAVLTDKGEVILSVANGESGSSYYQLLGDFTDAPAAEETTAETIEVR